MSYFESRLRLNLEDIEEVEKKLEICKKLGIKNLVLESIKPQEKIPAEIKQRIKNEKSIKFYFRVNLTPSNIKDFKNTIKNYNNFSEIISVETSNKEVQIHAARDSRVDILSFSDQNILKTLTPGVISLVKQNHSFIELSLAPIMIRNRTLQSKNLRNLYRFVRLVIKFNTPYLISGNFNELYDLRNPRALVSLCISLLEMPFIEARRAFKDNPRLLLKRIQYRNDKDNYEAGVKLIRGGI